MVTADARFARAAHDPRFIRTSKRAHKVVLDDRFKNLLNDDADNVDVDAGTRKKKGKQAKSTSVDKYGRKVKPDQNKQDLRAFYRLDNDKKPLDRARGEGLSESSSEEEDDHDEVVEEHGSAHPGRLDTDDESSGVSSSEDSEESDAASSQQGARSRQRRRRASSELSVNLDENAPMASTSNLADVGKVESTIPMVADKDITNRIAIVNLDWDHVRAIDLYKVFDSVLSPSAGTDQNGVDGSSKPRKSKTAMAKGRVLGVRIYPSEFGKGRMAHEEKEGPPLAIFDKRESAASQKNETILGKSSKKGKGKQRGQEEDVTLQDLLEENEQEEYDEVALRRYQLERLRYYYAVVTFDTTTAAAHAYAEIDGSEFEATANILDLRYVPDDTRFDDTPTDEATSQTVDLQAYKPLEFVTDALRNSKVKLTWDADDPQRTKLTRAAYGLDSKAKKGKTRATENDAIDYAALLASDSEADAQQRDRVRAAFGLSAEADTDDISEGNQDDGGMQITFTPALAGEVGSEAEGTGKNDETSLQMYERKERERRERKKAQRKAEKRKQSNGRLVIDDADDSDPDEAYDANRMFDDIQIAGSDADSDAVDAFFEVDESAPTFTSSGKAAKRMEKQEADNDAARLSLLVRDDDDGSGDEGRHFDMHAILRAEKISGKPKKALKKGKDRRKHEAAKLYLDKEQDRFEVDTKDERFIKLHEDHEFALDPSNPKYLKTKNMKRLLDESRLRRDDGSSDINGGKLLPNAAGVASSNTSDLSSLVASIKRKSKPQVATASAGKAAKKARRS